MKVEQIDREEIPNLREDEEALMSKGDPIKYLKAFARIARRPDRYKIGFDRQTLQWVARMWNEAAVASLGDDAITHEAERYGKLSRDLDASMVEYQTDGVVFLNQPGDWPRAATIHKAISAFAHAQINVIQ